MADLGGLIIQLVFVALTSGIGGSMLTLYVNTTPDSRYPYMRRMFLVFSGISWAAGLYLAVSSAMLLGG